MADKEEKKTINDVFSDKELGGIEKKFGEYLKWEKSTDLDKIGNAMADIWEKEFYQKTEKAIEKVAGGLDKKLSVKDHEDSLKGEFADIMLGYLEKTHSHASKESQVEFHELKERIKDAGLKGKELYAHVSNLYDSHIGHNPRDRRSANITKVLDTALAKSLEGEKLKGLLRKVKDSHIDGIMGQHKSYKWNEIVGDLHPAKARMYLRQKVLPQYDGKITNPNLFHMKDQNEVYDIWKGLKGEHSIDYEEHGLEIKPLAKEIKPDKNYKK